MEKMSLLLKKERLFYKEEEQQNVLPFRCCKSLVFFFCVFFIKGPKKTCYKMFFLSFGGISFFFATEGMETFFFFSLLFVPFEMSLGRLRRRRRGDGACGVFRGGWMRLSSFLRKDSVLRSRLENVDSF